MKKLSILFAILTFGFFMIITTNVGLAAGSARTDVKANLTSRTQPTVTVPSNKVAPKAVQKPTVPKAIFRRAEITNLEIGTSSSGVWFWEATVKNTGP